MVREEPSASRKASNNLKVVEEDLGVDVLIRSQSAKVDAGYVEVGFGMGCYVRSGGL
jgi:hypothetical protein